jgi:hypothetical protein
MPIDEILADVSKYKHAIKTTLDCAMAWTNVLLPPEQQADDKFIGLAAEIVDRIIPDPA